VPSENAQVKELRDWKVDRGDIHADPGIAQEILEFIEQRRVLSVAMTDSVIGCHRRSRFAAGFFACRNRDAFKSH
jgi:hypothetical protein